MSETAPIHANCVDHGGRGLLICGGAGQGKSTLSLQLMAMGANLVADDRVLLTAENGHLIARPAQTIQGRIEARGIGVLDVRHSAQTRIVAQVDLGVQEDERIPPLRHITRMGCRIRLLYKVDGIHFAPALWQFLQSSGTH